MPTLLMADQTISPQAYREFMSARERTAYWVQNYHPEDVYSPSTAPTEIEGYAPPSPTPSTFSLPPKMVLNFHDGRHVPIPHPARPSHHRSRTGSHIPSPLSGGSQSHFRDQDYAPPTPEEIHILPSRPIHTNPSNTTSSSSRSSHHRSKSVPRNHFPPEQEVPFIAPPVPRSGRAPHHGPGQPVYSPWISGGQPGYPSAPREPPVVMQRSPPPMGPNGMIYSHSAPPVMQSGYPLYDERMGRPMNRARSRGRHPPLRRQGSSDTSSEDSATYYSPTGGADHVIVRTSLFFFHDCVLMNLHRRRVLNVPWRQRARRQGQVALRSRRPPRSPSSAVSLRGSHLLRLRRGTMVASCDDDIRLMERWLAGTERLAQEEETKKN